MLTDVWEHFCIFNFHIKQKGKGPVKELPIDRDNTLVVGMIDYNRTFSWEKKLENPKVIKPDMYEKGFTDSMNRYCGQFKYILKVLIVVLI